MKVNETVKLLESGGARTLMAQLYGEDGVGANVKRYEDLLAGYEKMFGGEGDVKLFPHPAERKSAAIIQTTTTARCWQAALIWIVWGWPERMNPIRYILSARHITRILPLI